VPVHLPDAPVLRLPDVFPESETGDGIVDDAPASTVPPLPELPFDYYHMIFKL
jgi:hypothetical protein